MRRREFIAGLAGAAASPVACTVATQAEPIPIIGFLSTSPLEASGSTAFRSALREAGYVDGQNVNIEFRWGNNPPILRQLADELVRLQVAVIVTAGAAASALAAKAATSSIPIVLTGGADPVRYGLVANLNRPGGNITGITTSLNELTGKRLDLLLKLVPEATTIGYLTVPLVNDADRGESHDLEAAAAILRRQILVLECRTPSDFETAIGTIAERQPSALMVSAFALAFNNRNKIIALAANYKLPVIYAQAAFVLEGGLMSYGAGGSLLFRQVAIQYIARILKGAKPADLPVQQPTHYNLLLNLKTAKALGLTIPETLLATADEVIQ
jgi:putative tryptophan/tyrosine transport system substrate-binding protein